MQTLAFEILEQIAALAASSKSEADYETSVTRLVGDAAVARRALDWLPEAFGIVLASHVEPSIKPPATFLARNRAGDWNEYPLTADPIFVESIRLAAVVYHNGPREVFSRLASASSIYHVVNDALENGASLKDARLQPIRMFGLAAETYSGTSIQGDPRRREK